MDSGWIIAALAFMTIGGVLAISIFHFGFFLKDPANLEAASTVAKDRESAATSVSSETVDGRSLRQRLDEAPSLTARLGNRYVGSLGLDDLLNARWSSLRAALDGGPLHREQVSYARSAPGTTSERQH
jgi:hypothetical protein